MSLCKACGVLSCWVSTEGDLMLGKFLSAEKDSERRCFLTSVLPVHLQSLHMALLSEWETELCHLGIVDVLN